MDDEGSCGDGGGGVGIGLDSVRGWHDDRDVGLVGDRVVGWRLW